MQLYAIEISEEVLPLLTLLNQGVTPEEEIPTTWFIFDAEWNSEIPNKIVSSADFEEEYENLIPVMMFRV